MIDVPGSSEIAVAPRIVQANPLVCAATPAYTIGTLVTDRVQYEAMRASFIAGGFDDSACEYLYVDNTGANQSDAYQGLNAVLDQARGGIVILCHQDVRLITDNRATLDERLGKLSQHDAHWALAGNAGGVAPGRLAVRISDPHGQNQSVGAFPERVMSLDENFIIVRRNARIGFSNDLSGFHFYGADICLHAERMGCTAYVIDFHLRHLSPGKKDKSFAVAEQAFRTKWSRALGARWVQTTCSLVHLTGDPVRQTIGRAIDVPLARLARHLPSARGWKPTQKAPD